MVGYNYYIDTGGYIMSTNSMIVVQVGPENFKAIYCHWDGYVEDGVGEMLSRHYATQEKAEALVNMGDMSSLSNTLEDSLFYHRDSDEELTVRTGKSVGRAIGIGREYNYLFTEGSWFIISIIYGDSYNSIRLKFDE